MPCAVYHTLRSASCSPHPPAAYLARTPSSPHHPSLHRTSLACRGRLLHGWKTQPRPLLPGPVSSRPPPSSPPAPANTFSCNLIELSFSPPLALGSVSAAVLGGTRRPCSRLPAFFLQPRRTACSLLSFVATPSPLVTIGLQSSGTGLAVAGERTISGGASGDVRCGCGLSTAAPALTSWSGFGVFAKSTFLSRLAKHSQALLRALRRKLIPSPARRVSGLPRPPWRVGAGPRCTTNPRTPRPQRCTGSSHRATAAAVPAASLPTQGCAMSGCADILSRHGDAWTSATTHPFLTAVQDGTIAPDQFNAWLGKLRAWERRLAGAPRQCNCPALCVSPD